MPTKKYQFIKPPKGRIEDMDFDQLKKVMRIRGKALEEAVEMDLLEDPTFTCMDLVRKYRIDKTAMHRLLKRLAAQGNPGAQSAIDAIQNSKQYTARGMAEVRQYFLDHPKETVRQATKDLMYPRKHIANWVDRMLKDEPGAFKVSRTVYPPMSKTVAKKLITEKMMENPNISIYELSKQLRMERSKVTNYYHQLCDEYEQQHADMFHIVRSYCANEILTTINELKERAEQHPKFAARANEVKLQGLKLFMRLFKIDQPDTQNNFNTFIIDQRQRDAAAEAAVQHAELVPQLNLPNFQDTDTDEENNEYVLEG